MISSLSPKGGLNLGDHESGTCKELIETRIVVAKLEENVKIIPDLKDSIDKLVDKVSNQTGFIAGVSAAVSALITALSLFLTYKGLGK